MPLKTVNLHFLYKTLNYKPFRSHFLIYPIYFGPTLRISNMLIPSSPLAAISGWWHSL